MSYALVENGAVARVGLPQTGTLKDGSTVSGYDLLDTEVLVAEGWLPLVDIMPTYDAATEMVVHDGYSIEAAQVVVIYRIDAKPAPVPSLEEKITKLETENASLKTKASQAEAIATATSTDFQALTDYLAQLGVI